MKLVNILIICFLFYSVVKTEPVSEATEETKKRKLERETTPTPNVSGDGADTSLKQKKKKKKKLEEGENSAPVEATQVETENVDIENTVSFIC